LTIKTGRGYFAPMAPEPTFVIVDRDRMNLLGLMIGGVLESNLSTTRGRAVAAKLRGAVGIKAGRMEITVDFKEGEIILTRGLGPNLRAGVAGSLDGLLQVSIGRGAIKSFLAGEVSFSGNPFFLLKVLPLVRAPGGAVEGP